MLIRAVAGKAVLRKNRPDITIEVGKRGAFSPYGLQRNNQPYADTQIIYFEWTPN